MASATVDSAAAAAAAAAASTTDGGLLRLDSIPIVDLRLLSQSELNSLSRCSSSAADPNRRDDVVIPIIDRSVFNESAGSRKQTYSRLRLAPTDSPSAATPRSRTPHLRSPAAAYGSINTKTDPENVENHQIINLLKQFFVADMDPADLFPVKIEYLNSLPPQQFSSPPSPPPANFPSIGVKRKRGRPRKAVEVSVIDGSYADTLQLPMPSLSEFIPRDNADEKDREVLNSDGVAVDLAALGASEHPYREEIRQRTDGMRTEEELLGFLTGLNGRWGSRRKKKRIVDANEFGSKLPVGWKLSLSVKKKNGNVWLYCRRYISPSGLHFVTCKGVSSYLLSLHGMQDTNPCTFVQYNDIVNDADKLTTVPLVVHDDYEIETFSHAPSPPLDLVTANPEIQVTVNVGNASEDRIGESLCCHKCNLTFKDKDEFLNHQSSLHRKNRNKNIVRITDGVIIKDGKYECQFCHKTFSERHRYNGHVGTHVRFQPKLVGEFSQSAYPTSVNVYPTQDNAVEGSSKSHNAMDVCNTITNNGPTIYSNHDKNDGHFGGLEDDSRNIRGMDKATDTVTESNHSSVPEVLFTSNENKSLHNDACLNDSAAEISKDGSMMQGEMMMESTLSQNGAADKDMTVSVIENSASTDNPMQSMASKCLLDSNDNMEECPVVKDNQHRRNDSNKKKLELNFDPQNLGLNGSVFSLFGTQGQGQQEKDLAVSKSDLEILPCKGIATTESITSGPEASKLEKGPNISTPIADNGKASKEDNVPCSAVTCKVSDTLSFSKYENDSSKANNEGANMHEELQYGMDSNIQTWNTQEDATNKDVSEVFTHLLDVPGVHGMSKSNLAANDKNTYHYENNDGGVCGRETKMPEFDCLQNFGSGQSSDLFSSSSAIVSSISITGANQDTRLGVCSPFISATDKQLSAEDNMITMFNDTMKEHRQDPSEGILLNQSGISEVSNGAFTSDKVYTTANPSELNGIESKHELSLSFGSLQTHMCAELNRVEQESYRGNSFNIEPVGPKTYGNPTHSSILSSNIAADMEQARPFGYSNISFNDTINEPGNSFNVVQGERDWDGTRGNEVRTSSQNFMVGFGNSSLPTSECAAADGSWRNGPDNVFGGCYDANSAPHIQSSSFFPTFGLAPTTGQESSFGVDHNYGIQSDMMRPVRAQPVEYSFMSEQRVNSLPGEAKNFPYGTNMEQEMDPSFWLGKDALTPNATHISQATSICVCCRNVFLNEHVEAGVQTGAIGTICPSCSSRIPGHFNVL